MVIRGPKKPVITVDGAILTRVREAAGMSVSKLAKAIGCNKSSVSRWEMGRSHPGESTITRLVSILKTQDFVIVVTGKILDEHGKWRWPGGISPRAGWKTEGES